MNPIIEQIVNQDRSAYRDIPEVLRGLITEREWSFLSDQQKADLISDMTEPEV